jgi:hypothetical protein
VQQLRSWGSIVVQLVFRHGSSLTRGGIQENLMTHPIISDVDPTDERTYVCKNDDLEISETSDQPMKTSPRSHCLHRPGENAQDLVT